MANKVKVTADNTFPRCLAQTQAFPFPHHGTYLSGNLPLQISKGHPWSALVAWEGAAITALYFAEAFKCCEILANPFLGFSEPFQFRCGVSSALLASVFWKIFGFMAISTPFFFSHQKQPSFLQTTEALQFLNSHRILTSTRRPDTSGLLSAHQKPGLYLTHSSLFQK